MGIIIDINDHQGIHSGDFRRVNWVARNVHFGEQKQKVVNFRAGIKENTLDRRLVASSTCEIAIFFVVVVFN